MRPIDADALESGITALIFEYERRMPKWSPNDPHTSGKNAAMKYGYKADGAEAALNVVRRMPTIDAAPVKHGYWIAVANGRIKNWKQKCSCCGFYGRGLPPYCKMCGAKMDLKDGEP